MKKLWLLLFLVLFFGCKKNTDKTLRNQYLQEHIENCNMIIGRNFRNIERLRISYRKIKLYEKIENPIKKTHELHTYLNTDFYSIFKTENYSPFLWKDIIEKESYILHELDSILPPIFFMKYPKPMLEISGNDDTEELKLAKHFTNCMLLSKYVADILDWPTISTRNRELDMYISKNVMDTIVVDDTLNTQTDLFLNMDIRRYYIVKEINDIDILNFDTKTGRFSGTITGKKPSCILAYFNATSYEEVLHEVDF